MNLGVEGKICFVTGSTKGIGLRIGEMFKDEGCVTILNGRSNSSNLEDCGFSYISGDIERIEDCLKIRDKIQLQYKKLDILVCNVGGGRGSKPGQESPDEWHSSFSKNFYSTINIVDSMRDIITPGGAIVCISSLCSIQVTGAPIPYSVAKGAVNSYVKNAAVALSSKKIRINAVALGNILHDSSVWANKIKDDHKSVEEYIARRVPMGRLGSLEEAAGMAVFLSSCHSSFITGTIIPVDGGESLL